MSKPLALSVDLLRPKPGPRVAFSWTHFKEIPAEPGCYVLTNFTGEVLYVGQATTSIRDRFCAHLDTPEKRLTGPLGTPFWCYVLLSEKDSVSRIEQGWINQAILKTGARPYLNKIDAPL